ncbi:YhgE/Pip domain-containing protein [Ligilactobacillus salivarius]|uniref:YhgE/Pip domain-containing protein n=1 Tax=Ligilactobacillus salivarius TaxID=1624 RepID=A0ABD6J4E4_9LACO|nr:YhgE/Pip domain-containing protein [Ligilactobacillus salivarius]HBU67718.1 YhgE/Pip domain-containing protein [Lactobacillus sp.]MDE1498642.1 YhgE/Pip domain-containing protein [Ligilactobacillus salivarius]MDE1500475.1 YhgE/Pip domain-containing protein [Ligilactobacillus salivarius]MDE1523749.1 YhgE/Pip domain-containing protein [Ligilactobacillus salivarius]MDE1543103.1 YhgE/Pip domain-containing protein [Ligilactobacillus salivarius]
MKMVAEEFNNIRKHKILTATIIAIMIIPFLYSLFFLKSVWDPYGNTKYLPVAVVNNDKPVKYQGKTFKVGEDLEKELRENKDLGWHFVNAKEAKYGLSHKKYYMVITIPKNFSKNATTVLDKHPKKMQLTYNTNDALNYIGKVIGEEGAKQVNSSVRDSVSEAYATTMFDTVKKVGKGFNKAAKGATQLSDGAYTLSDGLKVYTAGVDQVNDGVIQLKNGVAPLSAGVLKLTTGASVLADGLNQLQSKTGTLASGVNKLATGSKTLSSGLNTLQGKTAVLPVGVKQLMDGSSKLNSGIGQYTGGVTELQEGLTKLNDNSNNLKLGAQQIADGNKELADEVAKIDVSQFNSGDTTQLINGLQQLQVVKQQLQPAMQAITTLQSSMSGMKDELTAVQSSSTELSNKLGSDLKTAGSSIQGSSANIQAVLGSSNLTDADKQKLQAALQQNQAAGSAISDAGTTAGQIKAQMDGVSAKLSGLQGQLSGLSAMSGKLTNAANVLNGITIDPNSLGNLKELSEKVATLQKATKDLAYYSSKLNDGVKIYTDGVSSATNGINTLANKNGILTTGSAQLAGGIGQMNAQIPALTSGVNQLANGGNQLASGLAQMNAQIPALTSGVNQLANGGNQLAGGLGQLNAQVPTLTNGINQLANGTQQLAANSGQLIDGANKISEGNGTLAKSLSAGAKEVNSQNLNSANANMFAAPTTLKHKNYSYVPNYGYALAPYMLSVALYVGALVFNLVYPIRRLSTPDGSATEWFFSKVAIGAVVAIGNAVVEVGLMMLAGLHPDHPAATFMNAISFSLAAMFIIMVLAMLFSNPGRFIGMIFLVIQLGACGGSFPIQITKGMNGFFQAINPYLPMTYSVYGFRESLSSGLGSSQMTISLTVQLIFIVASLLLLWISMSYLRTSGKVSYSEEPTSIED